MFAGGTVMFTRGTVMSVAATVVFVAADANPAFLGARRLCTRENAVFVRKTEVSAGIDTVGAIHKVSTWFLVRRFLGRLEPGLLHYADRHHHRGRSVAQFGQK